jgi:hypothetical protein
MGMDVVAFSIGSRILAITPGAICGEVIVFSCTNMVQINVLLD